MNKLIIESAASVGKIIVAVVLLFFTYLIFFQTDIWGVLFGLALLIFVTLPTIFVVYFKRKYLENHPEFIKKWKFLRVIYVIILFLFVLMLGFGVYRAVQKDKTVKAVEFINSKKITLDDVMGKNLPPQPDQGLNDSTIAGIDANKNYIRDDVELAIFKKYPDSAKIRAAELQYAQALQLELTQVFNSETLVTVMRQENRGIDCIGKTGPEPSLQGLKLINDRKSEVEELNLNTDLRKKSELDNLKKYMTGYSSLPGNECDLNLVELDN